MYSKRMSRFIAFLTALAMLAVLASCNGSDDPSSSESSASGSGLDSSASVRVWFTMNTAENNALQNIADDFESETGVSVEILDSNFFSIRQKFPVSAQSSEKPDIIYMQSADLGILAQNGYLRPIEWLDSTIMDNFYDIAFSALKYDGKNYGVGYSTDAYGIVYNKALISEIPSTWTEYFAKAEELTVRSGNEITRYGTQIAPNNYWFIYPLIKNEGGYYFGKNTDGSYNPADIGIDNAGTKSAITKLLALKSKGLTTQAYTEIDSNVSARFSNGKIAMFIYGLWDASIYKGKGIDYGYAPLPNNDDGTASMPLATVQGFVLNKFSDWPKESDAFLRYLMQDEHQQILFEAGNGGTDKTGARNTCSKAVVASSYVQSSDLLKSLVSVSLTAEVFPTNPEAIVIWTYSSAALNSIFFKDAPVDAKLKEFADAVKTDIAAMKN
ncbi:MAG: sugar ABC transporter substrate-binding protein [Saccharofermentanales bacterium]